MDWIIGILAARLRFAIGITSDVRGATAIEYALMAGGVALAIVSTVWTVGGNLKENFYDKLPGLF